ITVDAQNGDTLWRTQAGPAYWIAKPATYNSQAVFAVRRDQLFVLDRETGKQILWSIEKDSGQLDLVPTLEGVPSAAPAADEEQLYIVFDTRVSGYFVPDFRTISRLRAREESEEETKRKPSPQVRREWTKVLAPQVFQQPPLITSDFLGLTATDG